MKKRIGLFVGGHNKFNVIRDIDNFGWMLKDDFEVDLITTTPDDFSRECDSNIRIIHDNLTNSRYGIRSLSRYLNQNNPDIIVQVDRAQIHGNITSILSKSSDITSVYRYSADTFNHYKFVTPWKKVPYFFQNNIIGRPPLLLSDRFIALGPYGSEQLSSRGILDEKITILPPVIDPTRFQDPSLPDISIPESRLVVLFLGRREHLKGIHSLEAKIPDILDKRPDLQFVFVGEGKSLNVPRRLEDHISIIGPVKPANISSYLRLADVLIHPSFTEGLPRVLLESLATGTPVIARNVGDVSSVTNNTFESDEEMVNLVCEFEKLPVDSSTPFHRSTLQRGHITYFNSI